MIPCQYRFLVITVTSYWVQWRLKSSASLLFTQPFIQAQIKENIRAPHRWPLCRELTNDRWIPRTNGTITRKMFPFDDVIMVCYKSKPQLWLRHWRQLNYVFKRRTNNATEHNTWRTNTFTEKSAWAAAWNCLIVNWYENVSHPFLIWYCWWRTCVMR